MNNKILVVDDEEPLRDALEDLFSQIGYKAICAASGIEALEIIKTEDLHVFFLDLNLPGMNGIELCKEIRKQRPKDFICAVTGLSTVFGLIKCREAGFDEFLTKPFNFNTIIDIARYAFKRLERWEKF